MKLPRTVKSTRFVLTFWYSFILLAAFALFGTSVYLYFRHTEEAELERNLLEEVDWISRLVELERNRLDFFTPLEALSYNVEQQIVAHYRSNPRNYSVILTTIAGTILYESAGGHTGLLPASALPPDRTIVQSIHGLDGTSIRAASRRTDPFVVQVAYSEQETNLVLNHLLSIFGILVPVVLFVAITGGWIMSGMVLRPISQITHLADRISAENLSERIPERDVPDELGSLILTINKMFARLQTSFAQIREFSLSVAHELKTPLTILKGESELALMRPLSPEETQTLATTYLEETIRMSRIVDDLLTLARADAAQITIQHEPVGLSAIIEDLVEDATMLSTNKSLVVTLGRNDAATVMGDAARLRQLFRILVTNAVQYTDPGGSLAITSEVRGASVWISVSDTGMGIPAQHLSRIFERFYRVDEARSRMKGGSGLGLAIAKWITEAHHGTIRVESTTGKGSIFVVELPLA
jgi:heavy metal sensor kinase